MARRPARLEPSMPPVTHLGGGRHKVSPLDGRRLKLVSSIPTEMEQEGGLSDMPVRGVSTEIAGRIREWGSCVIELPDTLQPWAVKPLVDELRVSTRLMVYKTGPKRITVRNVPQSPHSRPSHDVLNAALEDVKQKVGAEIRFSKDLFATI